MSTENNTLFQNSVQILSDLISFKTISGEDNNSLIGNISNILLFFPAGIISGILILPLTA